MSAYNSFATNIFSSLDSLKEEKREASLPSYVNNQSLQSIIYEKYEYVMFQNNK